MKTNHPTWLSAAASLLTGGMLIALGYTSAAQTQTQSGQQQPDSVVAIVADALGLPFLSADQRPSFATYFDIRSSLPCVSGPLPFPPADRNLPVYAISDHQFLVDQTAGQVLSPLPPEYGGVLSATDAAAVLQTQAAELQDFVARIQASQLSAQSSLGRGMAMLEEDDPPVEEGYLFGTNDLWLQIVSGPVTNATADLVIHPPWNVTNGVYDLFATTNLVPAWWEWVLRCAPGETNVTVTNLTSPMVFFILGLTNDTDQGAMSDAWEGLLGLDPNNTNDDRTTPLVGISVVDSVATEQAATNTASFLVTRLGGHMKWPLTVALQLSGTAVISVNYSLAPITLTPPNVLVTIPSGQTEVLLTLTPIDDYVANGTKTATLTLGTNDGWEVDAARASATAWILEPYTRTYTTVAEFNQGVLDGLEAVATSDNGHLQFKTNLPPQFPFINVACSDRGTVARINTTNGQVIGEYRTAPAGMNFTGDSGSGPQPSRTTVDLFGNVWVANRADDVPMNGTTNGSITRIGLILGTRYSKTNDVYYPDPDGQYVNITNATYNTCVDRDGDGYIRTSAGLADILPWSNQRDGLSDADSRGGVSTAQDEAITEYVRVDCTRTRTIAVDKFNDIWVGGTGNRKHLKVNGLTGSPVPNSVFGPHAGGYGSVIDTLGNLWSSSSDLGLVWLRPPAVLPPTTNDWQALSPDVLPYGIAVDPLHPRIWQTGGAATPDGELVFRWHTNGTPFTNLNGTLLTHPHGASSSQGLAVDANGHAWVAHGSGSHTVGHLDTNGVYLGSVSLRLPRLRAEYFANTNLAGWPVLARADAPIDFDWGAGSPDPVVPTNYFSARWNGVMQVGFYDEAVFFVSADAGAGFRLTVNSSTIIDNWNNPNPNPVEMSGSNWLFSGENQVLLEYKEFSGDARIKLSWIEPGTTNKVVIPRDRLEGPDLGTAGPTGVSVDSLGYIWAANKANNTAMRINPNAGAAVVANGVTNYVGEVDMVVDLGNGSGHPEPYNVAAAPYNYSDMTGFNNRIVNPSGQPLKGYWTVIEDSGMTNEIWQRVAWSNNLPITGCSMEAFVRASDNRQSLANQPFVPASNNVPLVDVLGRYIELRVGLTRDNPNKQPVLYDLTLYGNSSGLVGNIFLEDSWAYETEDAWFWVDLAGPEPVSYQWHVMPPWTNQWALVSGATGPELVLTNVDLWDDWTWVSVTVSNAAGQTLQFGPAELAVWPLSIGIPASGSSGPAERYPATINVRGQPTNGLSRVEVTLNNLTHYYPADLDILLVSPSGTKVMLMSDAGGSFAVTNATLVFHPASQGYPYPPESSPIPSGQTTHFSPANYGDQEGQLPGAPQGPYSTELNDLLGTDPNGLWRLFIYDDKTGQTGVLQDSWSVDFYYQ
jgi:PA14 domain